MNLGNLAAGAETWEKVIRKVRVGMMPPQGNPRPDENTRRALVSYLESGLDKAAAAKPDPGRPLVHRLNRAEYANAIRDLLTLDVDASSLLPPDDSAYGFDNIADVLGASPVLLERYLSAAGKISALAVGDPDIGTAAETFRVRQDASQDVHIEGLPVGTIGGLLARTTLPLDGEYQLQVKFFRSSNDTLDPAGHPHIDTFTITGPFNPTGAGDTPSRHRIFSCRPENVAAEGPCARKILATLVHRAYRGMESPSDLARLIEFYQKGRKGGTFESGIQLALQRILASPKFALRVERDPAGAAPGTIYRISDLELASRLSFFLWSSIPDDELLHVATQGKLKSQAVLDQQVRRMLADPKSEALVSNFAGQWLYLRNLRGMIPNSLDFPDFDDNLRQAFQRETELFFTSIMREDRNVLDLMTADYTYLNERLARHYGVPNIYGSKYRRVMITNDARRGLLGQGSILMVTSHTDRTSPVVRGKWILDNLLGAPPPPMPANVPPLNENNQVGGKILTMRERMEQHRENPYCASCHQIMDPIGFSLENFDAVGAWRDREGGTGGTPIDASGQLLDGTKVSGPVELRKALLRDPEIFIGTITEKLMTYALGRGLSYSDMPMVRGIVRDTASRDYRFTSLVLGIVHSTAFQMRSKI